MTPNNRALITGVLIHFVTFLIHATDRRVRDFWIVQGVNT